MHTPGPWDLTPYDESFFSVDARGHQIAEVYDNVNARLIAAAPDLLEALQSLAFQAETVAMLPSCGETEFLRGLAKAARKVITKATGA